MENVGTLDAFKNGKVENVTCLRQHQRSISGTLNGFESFFKTGMNEIVCTKSIFEHGVEYYSDLQTNQVVSSGIKIKSEDISDNEESEEYLCVPRENPDIKIALDWKNDAFHPLSENAEAENRFNRDAKSIQCKTNSLENTMKCEVEDTEILFGTEQEFTQSYVTGSIQSSLEFINKEKFHFTSTPSSPLKENRRSDQAIFTSKEDLEDERSTHLKYSNFEETISVDQNLDDHCNSKHSKDKCYRCPTCHKNYSTKRNLKVHQMSIHSKLKPHKCLNCSRNFATKQQLETHNVVQHLKLTPHKCFDCDNSYVLRHLLDRHRTLKHSKLKPHQCPNCDRSFTSKQNLDKHRTSVHLKVKPYNCLNCERSFSSRDGLKHHHTSQHLNLKPHKCSDCDKSFVAKQCLNRHQKKHLEVEPHRCPNCTMSFSLMSNLERHRMPVHLKLRPYNCPTCGKGFATKYSRDSHRMLHMNNSPHPCAECDKSYPSKKSLQRHNMTHHLKLKLVSHQCVVCDRNFSTKRSLDIHKSTNRHRRAESRQKEL